MMVRAKTMGFYDGVRRRPGAEFKLLPGDKPGKWMEPADEPVLGAKPPAPEPTTLSEMAKQNEKERLKRAKAKPLAGQEMLE